jgi:phage antirepressor YoqD-like protein
VINTSDTPKVLLKTEVAPVTMTSREIAGLTGSTHDSVLKTVRRLVAEGVVLANETPYVQKQNGQTYFEFVLSFRDTMVVVSGYSAELRAKIIDRWQELEAAAARPVVLSRMDILRMALDSEQRAIDAEKLASERAILIEQQKPAVEFVDRYVVAKGLSNFREVCKMLKAKQAEVSAWLIDRKIMYRLAGKLTPHAPHLDAGRFEVKAGVSRVNGKAYHHAKFTPKGVEWIAAEWAQHQVQGGGT